MLIDTLSRMILFAHTARESRGKLMNIVNILATGIALSKALAGIVIFQCAIAAALSVGHVITAPFKKLLSKMCKDKRMK